MKRSILLLLCLAAALLAGGIAYASIPDSTGLIHGCYLPVGTGAIDKQTYLRVVDTEKGQHCGKGESTLNWEGGGGSAPNSWLAIGERAIGIGGFSTGTVMANLSLPTGPYTLDASVWVSGDSGGVYVVCYITTNNAPPNDGVDPTATAAVDGTVIRQASLSLTGATMLASAGSVQVRCFTYGGPGNASGQAFLRATAANQLTIIRP